MEKEKVEKIEWSLLKLIYDIRAAVGDPEGQLIQDELVERCKFLYDEVEEQARLLGKSGSREASLLAKIETTNKTQLLQQEINTLAERWYRLIGQDHHKDRDCHWYINSVWSYGQPVKYRVEHYGYILDDISEDFTTYSEACLFLIETLKDVITKEENDGKIE